jgi:hypothetical protein
MVVVPSKRGMDIAMFPSAGTPVARTSSHTPVALIQADVLIVATAANT